MTGRTLPQPELIFPVGRTTSYSGQFRASCSVRVLRLEYQFQVADITPSQSLTGTLTPGTGESGVSGVSLSASLISHVTHQPCTSFSDG